MSGLTAEVRVARPNGFQLDVELEIAPGRTAALLGPNGAGKTTLVEAVAGLIPIDSGSIRLNGRLFDSPSQNLFVPAEDRNVGVGFQDYLLFPHMTVLANTAFGLRARGMAKPDAHVRATVWLGRLGLADLADADVGQLSGGQAQKVALARALCTEPDLLLLDEPLAALDTTTRMEVRRELADTLEHFEGPRLVITHDPTEAFLLADEVYVMEAGVITQHGTAEEIRMKPKTEYAADVAGSNLLRGTAADGVVEVNGHSLHVADLAVAGPVLATIHPRAISVHRDHPEGSPRNIWETEIERIEHYGDRVRLMTSQPMPLTAEITPNSLQALGLEVGTTIWLSVKATEVGIQEA